MSFGQFWSILKARKWASLSLFVAVVALTLLASLIIQKRYTAVASIVVDVRPDPIASMAYQPSMSPGFMATQVDILASERVASRVVRDLNLLSNPMMREQWQRDTNGAGTLEQWAIDLLQKQLDVKPSRDSNVLQIIYRSADPRFAAALANAFAQAFIATTLELRTDPARQFSSFFDTQSKDARETLEKAQNKLSAFQREKSIIASDERLDIETGRLNELSSQLVQIQAVTSESRSRQGVAEGAAGDRLQEVLNNPLLGGLKADLSRSEARLQELNSRFGENHPQVRESKASIAELRSRIEAETARVRSSVGVTSSINAQREAQIRSQLEDQRAKVLRLKAVRDEGQVLMRDVESAQRAYEVMMSRLNLTSIESRSTQSYASVLTVAQPPLEPSSPKVFVNTLISLVVGAVMAIGLALFLETRSRRVRTPADLVTHLGVAVLGVLPKPGSKRGNAAGYARAVKRISGGAGTGLTRGA